MAIIYSYPHAVPTINDMVLGAKFKENEGISTNSFYMSDLVTLISAEIPGIPGSEGPQGPPGTTGSPGIQGIQGEQGIQGLAGTVGPAGLEWQGTWASGTSYVADDAVAYDGASWFCILATSGTTPPDADATHWALLAAQGAPGLQGIQGTPGIQGPPGTPGIQGIQGIQGVPGTGATQTLQQTVDLGNTIADIYGSTQKIYANLNRFDNLVDGTTGIYGLGIFNKSDGTNFQNIELPTSLAGGTKIITFPNANGTVALTNDITLQKAFDNGKTMTVGSFKTGVFDSVNGISVENTSSLSKTTLETTKITLTKNASGLKTTNILQAVTPVANRTIYFPDADGTIALTSQLSSFVPYTGATSALTMGENNITVGAGVNNRNITINTDTFGGFIAQAGAQSIRLSPVDLRLTDSAGGSLRLDLKPPGLTTGNNFTINFPAQSGQLAMLSNISQVKTSSFTAVDNQYYYTTQTLTITDPLGSATRGYIVYVIDGLATIGGVVYGAGSLVYRYQNGVTWTSTNMNNTPTYKVYTALLSQGGY